MSTFQAMTMIAKNAKGVIREFCFAKIESRMDLENHFEDGLSASTFFSGGSIMTDQGKIVAFIVGGEGPITFPPSFGTVFTTPFLLRILHQLAIAGKVDGIAIMAKSLQRGRDFGYHVVGEEDSLQQTRAAAIEIVDKVPVADPGLADGHDTVDSQRRTSRLCTPMGVTQGGQSPAERMTAQIEWLSWVFFLATGREDPSFDFGKHRQAGGVETVVNCDGQLFGKDGVWKEGFQMKGQVGDPIFHRFGASECHNDELVVGHADCLRVGAGFLEKLEILHLPQVLGDRLARFRIFIR